MQGDNDRRGSVVTAFNATDMRRTTSLPPVSEVDHAHSLNADENEHHADNEDCSEDYAAELVAPDSPVLDLPPTPSPPQVRLAFVEILAGCVHASVAAAMCAQMYRCLLCSLSPGTIPKIQLA
jgi:hypothetical protein